MIKTLRSDSRSGLRCDLYCQVIDNFGDAGVCWRLARALASARGWRVRLVIDDPRILALLGGAESGEGAPEVVTWRQIESGSPSVGEVVIEGFGCRLPSVTIEAMCAAKRPPIWINLEYLSAESWVEDCHRLPSPDPRSGLVKYFFFPGFTPRTGGLLRESSLVRRQSAFKREGGRDAWLAQRGITVGAGEFLVSMFCYGRSPVGELLSAWQSAGEAVHCLICAGQGSRVLQEFAANATFPGLRVTQLPFLPQDDYDLLLLACDLNYVRGEDSFVRAQWAGRPFVWQAYRQAEDVHWVKLDAFLDRYLEDVPAATAGPVRAMHDAWNGRRFIARNVWTDFRAQFSAIAGHNAVWRGKLAGLGNLADHLADFCESKL